MIGVITGDGRGRHAGGRLSIWECGRGGEPTEERVEG